MDPDTIAVPPEELILLTPGPACTSARVKKALLRGDLCHREAEFGVLLQRLRAQLPVALGLSGGHETVLVSGSGTAAMELAVTASARPGRSLIIVSNGVYGERLVTIARAHGITVHEVRPDATGIAAWTTPIEPAAVARALADHPDADGVVCVHHETTTGLINPIREIGALLAPTEAVFVVDAISSTGIEEQDLAEVGADLICGSANKGLHGLPGAAFVLLSAKGVRRAEQAPTRGGYLHTAAHLAAQRRGDVLYTPAVQIYYALDEAIAEYLEAGGFPARRKLYRERATLVREGYQRLGLRLLVEPAHCGNSVTTLHLPDGVGYERLHDEMKRLGYVIYAGQGQLSTDYFRICTVGEIPWAKLEHLESTLAQAIATTRA